jgi:outer membrane protein OmpA-like peptidoglycan-associated protein
VEKSGYLTDEIDLPANSLLCNNAAVSVRPIQLKKINKEAVRLENIYFKFDAHRLTAESRQVIDSTLFRMMRLNPGLIIEISAHTDNKGTTAYNMELSEKRAESVAEYLEKCGIDRGRIKPRGYGMSAPVASAYTSDGEDNPTGRQLNRRVEFKILGENFPESSAKDY